MKTKAEIAAEKRAAREEARRKAWGGIIVIEGIDQITDFLAEHGMDKAEAIAAFDAVSEPQGEP